MSPITVTIRQTPSDSDQKKPESFSQIPDHDLEAIGRNCQFEYCHQLDFLPFRCESCKGTFCLDHRTETAHKCSHAGEWARRRQAANTATTSSLPLEKPTIYNSIQCSHPACKTLIDTAKDPAVHCDKCNRKYCLKHRLREEHDCSKLIPLGARPGHGGSTPNDTIKSMFSRIRTWGNNATSIGPNGKPKPTSAASRMVQVNTMKKTAKGEASIPADKRIYLHVVGTSTTQRPDPPTSNLFFDTRWKVGRVLDDAARRLGVENLNNRADSEEAKLRIFHIESGEFLEFSDTIGDGKLKSGDTIVLMRGAGVMLGK
ncbi:hypothetical protein DTO166G4_1600 [Paecilomyces variotii]|uniref:AN1-type domain-containing protein n=1 Tax=Byssochlamys spectabilis TaxID=264951 RepID=A0A443HR44_BYSSP|nr:hypothetical protein C8Q69DRAFT_473320 [Paecilomyces variotii]KAJ9194384.1 hypothetical protein DTO032I3_7402 [Paecilomyces variotii]KAJ9198106.1 hypothetical protein DTO164E3_5362 [Paecilomyces variotii]KAJ9216754.1 hypothetical protein DTO166G4_1600 [Paecilomyces variotii]KAJ9222405.1 hypothetical protein DTO169C6_5340 [Paecilomyces variotii]KAJ9229685.1 hypothetical protein DTO169E5_8759 [Paecilomyces variotii]